MRFRRSAVDSGVNPNRTADLFALTAEGYIIAQDISCQYEYIAEQRCPTCDTGLITIAQINRAFQGLNEIATICPTCHEKYAFIFDISNAVYQTWWAGIMGEMYFRTYDGPPRTPAE
jgi:hypothetical protein